MIIYCSCFPKIDNLMFKAHMSRKKLSDKAQIKYYSLGNKLRNETEFTRPEMYRIKKVLEDATGEKLFLDELFTTSNEYQQSA